MRTAAAISVVMAVAFDHAGKEACRHKCPMPRRGEDYRRVWLGALIVWVALAALGPPTSAASAGPEKKLIEYGWDVPTPAQMRENLASMEKRPFDGLIFRKRVSS